MSRDKALDDLIQESIRIQKQYFVNVWEVCNEDIDTAICYFNITRENANILASLSFDQLNQFDSFTIPLLQPKHQKNKDGLNILLTALLEGNADKLMLSFSSFTI